jgi:hypothetical protein
MLGKVRLVSAPLPSLRPPAAHRPRHISPLRTRWQYRRRVETRKSGDRPGVALNFASDRISVVLIRAVSVNSFTDTL